MRHEVKDNQMKDMEPREILLSDRFSPQTLDSIERKVCQTNAILIIRPSFSRRFFPAMLCGAGISWPDRHLQMLHDAALVRGDM